MVKLLMKLPENWEKEIIKIDKDIDWAEVVFASRNNQPTLMIKMIIINFFLIIIVNNWGR